jgi:hypothetical protein
VESWSASDRSCELCPMSSLRPCGRGPDSARARPQAGNGNLQQHVLSRYVTKRYVRSAAVAHKAYRPIVGQSPQKMFHLD